METRRIGVRELRRDLAGQLQGHEPIIIERHDKVLGIYIPVQPVDRAQVAAAVDRLHAAYEAAFVASGMTRDEFARLIAGDHEADPPGNT